MPGEVLSEADYPYFNPLKPAESSQICCRNDLSTGDNVSDKLIADEKAKLVALGKDAATAE